MPENRVRQQARIEGKGQQKGIRGQRHKKEQHQKEERREIRQRKGRGIRQGKRKA
jgi:hypothetical protein